MYRVPDAEQRTPQGGFVCSWRFEQDASAPRGQRPAEIPGTLNQRMSMVPWTWHAEGEHKVICDVQWRPDPNGPRRATGPTPAPRRLELPVRARSIEALSRERFDATATPGAYASARLAPLIEREQARQRPTPESAGAATERDRRIETMDRESARIEENRRVVARAQLTPRDGQPSRPLALVIGPATGQPGRLALVDFTPGVRRMDIGTFATTAEAVSGLENRNSYPAGLVEIDVPAAPEHGVAALHRTFATTGQSSTGAWSSNVGHAGLGLAAAAGVAALVTAPITVPLLIAAGLVGGVASAISLAERARDAQPDPRGIAIDVLGIASAIVTAGGAAAFRTTVTIGERTMRVANLTGGIALAADGASAVLVASEGVEEILRVWNDPNVPESERLQRIATIVATVAATGGMVVVSARYQLHASRAQGAAPEPRAPHEPRAVDEPRAEPRAPLDDRIVEPAAPRTASPAGDGASPGGLRAEPSMTGFVSTVQGIEQSLSSLTSVEARAGALRSAINMQLERTGLPAVQVAHAGMNGGALFSANTWTITVDAALLSRQPLGRNELAQLVEAVYHEARHAEQWWLVARYLQIEPNATAAGAIRPDVFEAAARAPRLQPGPELDRAQVEYRVRFGGQQVRVGRVNEALDAATARLDRDGARGERARTQYQRMFDRYERLPTESDARATGEAARAAFTSAAPRNVDMAQVRSQIADLRQDIRDLTRMVRRQHGELADELDAVLAPARIGTTEVRAITLHQLDLAAHEVQTRVLPALERFTQQVPEVAALRDRLAQTFATARS